MLEGKDLAYLAYAGTHINYAVKYIYAFIIFISINFVIITALQTCGTGA